MSNKYEYGEVVPTEVLAGRLSELSQAVINGKEAIEREFTKRIPAELDRDADLVLSSSAERMLALEAELDQRHAQLNEMNVRVKHFSEKNSQLEAEVERLNRQLNAYKKTINQIDDYLEYASESEIKSRIMYHIDELTNELSNMQVKS